MKRRLALPIFWAACTALSFGPAVAADCQRGNFADWLDGFKQEAVTLGISQKTITSALNGVTYDPIIIAHDHAQSGACRPENWQRRSSSHACCRRASHQEFLSLKMVLR